jgi:hypothetical protein
MKRALFFAVALAVPLTVASLSAQEKPNFAGTWKLASEAGDPFTSPQLVVVQNAKTLTVTSTSQMGEIKTTYNLDGTEARSPLDFNGTTIDRVTKAAWSGSKLVLTAISDFNGQTFEVKSTWTLNADGTLLSETTRPDFQGGGAPTTTKSTYKKG